VNVVVRWSLARTNGDEFSFRRVLYAYLHPRTKHILYIGKADYCSVRERLRGQHKCSVAQFFKKLKISRVYALVGVLYLPKGIRFSSALLSDIESLLISELQPYANVQCITSRICRPGLSVTCRGSWPSRKRHFADIAI
jgi:hypothetical protein